VKKNAVSSFSYCTNHKTLWRWSGLSFVHFTLCRKSVIWRQHGTSILRS